MTAFYLITRRPCGRKNSPKSHKIRFVTFLPNHVILRRAVVKVLTLSTSQRPIYKMGLGYGRSQLQMEPLACRDCTVPVM